MPQGSLYRYILQITRRRQVLASLLTLLLAPLAAVPLELQRRIVDDAVPQGDSSLLFALGGGYIAVMLVQNALKYTLNLTKGRVLEDIARDIRQAMLRRLAAAGAPPAGGTVADVLVAESEEVAGFASESLSVPLLQGGTILFVLGYLVWVEPLIAVLAAAIYLPQATVVPLVQHRINRITRLRTRMMRRLTGAAIAARGGVPPAAAFGGQIERLYRLRIAIYRRKYFLTLLGNLLDAAGPLAVLVAGGWLVLHGQTTIGALVVFLTGLQRIADPWDQLVSFYRSVSNARIAYGLIAGALHDSPPAGGTGMS